MKIVVVIPTYNEAENIQALVPVLAEEFKKAPHHNIHALVVDGNSPDGTSQAVMALSKEYPFLHLLTERKKAGLGAAYMQAFDHAMNKMDAEVLVEMDADLQHDPKDIVRFLDQIDNGYDYIIGSRFTKGGSIPKEWALYRKILSWGGSFFAKIVLWIFSINDFTSGFKASRVKGFADQLDLDNIMTKGFAYKIDFLFRMHKLGAKFKEVPIAFGLRDRGDSKMERNNLIDTLRVILLLRFNENKNFFKFIMVGFAGLGVDSTLFNVLLLTPLMLLGLSINTTASLISGFIAMTVTFLLNNFWSFGERKHTAPKKLLMNALVFYVFSYIPVVFRSWLIDFAVAAFGDTFIVNNSAFFVGILLGLIWNFTIYSRIIWRKTHV